MKKRTWADGNRVSVKYSFPAYGDIDIAAYRSIVERESIPVPESGCWLWTRALSLSGYGRVRYRRTQHSSHKASFFAFKGDIPDGMTVCHKCDTPSCVNPSHLFLSCHQGNMDDMAKKNRASRRGGNVLDRTAVVEIYKSPKPYSEVARKFNVSYSTVMDIVHGKAWRHVTSALKEPQP